MYNFSSNIKLYITSPLNAFLIGCSVFVFLLGLAPLSYIFDSNLELLLYLLVCIFSLILGLVFTLYNKNKFIIVNVERKRLRRNFFIVLTISVLGSALKLIDKFYFRGIQLGNDFFANRELLEQTGSSPLGMLSSILYPSCYALLFYLFFNAKYKFLHLRYVILTFFVSLFPVFDSLLVGSRSITLLYFMFVFLFFTVVFGSKYSIKSKVIFLTLFCTLIWASGKLFIARTMLFGLSPIDSAQISGYATFVKLDPSIIPYLSNNIESFSGEFIFGIINISQYYLHGMFEFIYMYNETGGKGMGGGGIVNFFVVAKLYYAIAGIENFVFDFTSALYRPGVFTTLLGPFYSDFGAYAPLILCFFGIMITFFSRKAMKASLSAIFLNQFFCIVLFFSPVISFWVGANGFYIFSNFLLLSIFTKILGSEFKLVK